MPVIKHQCKSVHTNSPALFTSPPARCGDIAVCSSASMEEGWGRVNQAPYRESAMLVTSCFSNLLFGGITLPKPFLLDRSVWEGLEAPTCSAGTTDSGDAAVSTRWTHMRIKLQPHSSHLEDTWSSWHTCMWLEEGHSMYLFTYRHRHSIKLTRTKIYRIPTDFKIFIPNNSKNKRKD